MSLILKMQDRILTHNNCWLDTVPFSRIQDKHTIISDLEEILCNTRDSPRQTFIRCVCNHRAHIQTGEQGGKGTRKQRGHL